MTKGVGLGLLQFLIFLTIVIFLLLISAGYYLDSQKKARDGVRKQDISAIAKVLELNFNDALALYSPLKGPQFVNGIIPRDPLHQAWRCGGNRLCGYCYSDLTLTECNNGTPLLEVNALEGKRKYYICTNLEAGGSFCLQSQR